MRWEFSARFLSHTHTNAHPCRTVFMFWHLNKAAQCYADPTMAMSASRLASQATQNVWDGIEQVHACNRNAGKLRSSLYFRRRWLVSHKPQSNRPKVFFGWPFEPSPASSRGPLLTHDCCSFRCHCSVWIPYTGKFQYNQRFRSTYIHLLQGRFIISRFAWPDPAVSGVTNTVR